MRKYTLWNSFDIWLHHSVCMYVYIQLKYYEFKKGCRDRPLPQKIRKQGGNYPLARITQLAIICLMVSWLPS